MPLPTLFIAGNLIQPDLPNVIPIDYVKTKARELLNQHPNFDNPFLNRLMIIEAKTASGKSTSIPPWMYIIAQEFPMLARKKVICTQPRILTAQDIPESLNGMPYFEDAGITFRIGQNLGYKTSAVAEPLNGSGLLFVTLGTLEQELKNKRAEVIIDTYSVILIDEAHERQLIFDKTMIQLKKFYEDNRKSPYLPLLILMSATFDYEKYRLYFNATQDNVMRVQGFSHPIDDRWASADYPLLYPAAADRAYDCIIEEVNLEIAEFKKQGIALSTTPHQIISKNHILIFVPGAPERRKVAKFLQKKKLMDGFVVEVDGLKVYVHVDEFYIDSTAVKKVNKDFIAILGHKEKHRGKPEIPPHDIDYYNQIIQVSAVAETGLTLDNLKYVIDCGWSRESEFNPTYNITSILLSKPAAQSRIMQRRGRCGRMKPGVFIPLYTKTTFEAIQRIQTPEIILSDPTSLILGIIVTAGHFDKSILQYMMDLPPQESIAFSLHKLQMLGMITNDYKPLHNGRLVHKVGEAVSMEACVMILAGFTYDVSIDDLILMAVLAPRIEAQERIYGFSEERKERETKRNPFFRAPDSPSTDEYESIFSVVLGGHKISNVYYKLRAFVADDFIMQLIVYRAFIKQFESLKPTAKTGVDLFNTMRTWCDRYSLSIEALLDTYNTYLDVKSALITAGINVLHNRDKDFVSHLEEQETIDFLYGNTKLTQSIVDPVVKLKLCIYAGYKFNLATLNPATMTYHINYGGYPVAYMEYFKNNPEAKINWNQFEVMANYTPERILFRSSVIGFKADIKKYVLQLVGISIISGFL